jgi:hypothetical protein
VVFLCGVLRCLLYKFSHNGSNDVHYKEINRITQLEYIYIYIYTVNYYYFSAQKLQIQHVCFLLGNSPTSEFCMPTFGTLCSIFIGGWNRVFRNVGIQNSDAGELPRRKHTTFRTRRTFEIKNRFNIIASSDANITTCPHKRCAIYTDIEETSRYYIHKSG